MDRVATSLLLHARIRLQPFGCRVFCAVFVVAKFTGISALAPTKRGPICWSNFLVAEVGDQQSDPQIILLAGFSPDSSAVPGKF